MGMEWPEQGSKASSLGGGREAHTRVRAHGGTQQVGAGCGATQGERMAEESDGDDLGWGDEVAGAEHSDTGEDTEGEEEGEVVATATASSEVGTAGGVSVPPPTGAPPGCRPRWAQPARCRMPAGRIWGRHHGAASGWGDPYL